MAGGQKLTQEEMFPAKKHSLELNAQRKGLPPPSHEDYTEQRGAHGLSFAAGAGLDVKLAAAVALRVASLEYTRSNVTSIGGISYRSQMHLTSGLVFRFGAW
jgi:hypothetical protein